MRTFALAVILLFLGTPAVAQIDYNAINAASIQNSNLMNKLYDRRDNPSGPTRYPQSSARAIQPSFASVGGRYFGRPADARGAAIAFTYRSTPELRRAATEGYIARTTQNNPQAGRMIAGEIAKHDVGRIYASLISPFGLRDSDTADALAAYTLLGWLIATGGPDPSPGAARAVRNQVAQGLAEDPRFRSPRTRAELAEEMKLLFVTLHAGWQSARMDGSLRAYSDGVASTFRRFSGIDLRSMRLSERGLARG